MYVVDASVFVADLRPSESHHSAARALLDRLRAGDDPIHTPVVALAEIASAISRGTGRPALGRRVIHAVQKTQALVLEPVDNELGQLAADLAAEHQLRGCDAIYVALAKHLGATLITLDVEQRERSAGAVSALDPTEVLALRSP